MYYDDDLRLIAAALPRAFKTSEDFKDFLAKFSEQRPEYWLAPITTAEAAAFLNMTPNALRTMRCRHGGPPGFDGKRYTNRLTILRWRMAQSGLEIGEAA